MLLITLLISSKRFKLLKNSKKYFDKLSNKSYAINPTSMINKLRMLRFRMSCTDDCERCGEVETYRHLFWECRESRRVWRSFNEYIDGSRAVSL